MQQLILDCMINLALYLYLNLSLYYDVYRFVAAFSLRYGDYVYVGKQSVCSDTNCCDFMEGHPTRIDWGGATNTNHMI